LPYAEGAAFDSKNNKHDQCLKGTRTRLLKEIEDWSKEANAKNIFWLKGVAGTGKSTIARTVAYKFAEQNSLGASFFFLRGKEDRGNARLFVTTLARQLSEQQPTLRQYIRQAMVDRSTIADKDLNEQWTHLIIGPLSQVKGGVPPILIFVIDALDECGDKTDIRNILHLVTQVRKVKTIQVRVFVTSRPDAPVNNVFRNMDETVHYDLALHKVPREEIREDIYFFLKHRMAKVKNDKGIKEEWPAEEDINILIQRADRLFIYAATVCRFIENSRFPKPLLSKILQIKSTSQSSTTELDTVYLQIVEQSVIDDSVPDERDELISLFREVVGSVIILFDPLSTSDLSGLLNVSSESVSGTLEPLHSVLDISEDEESSIQPFHLSFRDFLLDNKRCSNTQFWVAEDKAHSNLVSRCIKIMSDALMKDICILGELDCLVSGIDQNLIKTALPAHIQYACRYWIRHLQRTEIHLHHKEVLDFLRDHFLHWLEALSLMRQISEGLLVIQALKSMLTVSTSRLL
jgi:NACHT domain